MFQSPWIRFAQISSLIDQKALEVSIPVDKVRATLFEGVEEQKSCQKVSIPVDKVRAS